MYVPSDATGAEEEAFFLPRRCSAERVEALSFSYQLDCFVASFVVFMEFAVSAEYSVAFKSFESPCLMTVDDPAAMPPFLLRFMRSPVFSSSEEYSESELSGGGVAGRLRMFLLPPRFLKVTTGGDASTSAILLRVYVS